MKTRRILRITHTPKAAIKTSSLSFSPKIKLIIFKSIWLLYHVSLFPRVRSFQPFPSSPSKPLRTFWYQTPSIAVFTRREFCACKGADFLSLGSSFRSSANFPWIFRVYQILRFCATCNLHVELSTSFYEFLRRAPSSDSSCELPLGEPTRWAVPSPPRV